jgi:hypothetical protein
MHHALTTDHHRTLHIPPRVLRLALCSYETPPAWTTLGMATPKKLAVDSISADSHLHLITFLAQVASVADTMSKVERGVLQDLDRHDIQSSLRTPVSPSSHGGLSCCYQAFPSPRCRLWWEAWFVKGGSCSTLGICVCGISAKLENDLQLAGCVSNMKCPRQ